MKKPLDAKKTVMRCIIYIAGMMILAAGIITTTKGLLGVSPIISVPYIVSDITGFNFGNLTFFYYVFLVVLQYIIRGKNSRIYDLLQIPISLIFTRFMNFFSAMITVQPDKLWIKILIVVIGVTLTGIGLSMSVRMDLIVNPGDGIVQALSWKIHKGLGLCKNIIDLSSVAATFIIGLCSGRLLFGIGLGTVIAMILTGRVVALFTKLAKKPLMRAAGLPYNE